MAPLERRGKEVPQRVREHLRRVHPRLFRQPLERAPHARPVERAPGARDEDGAGAHPGTKRVGAKAPAEPPRQPHPAGAPLVLHHHGPRAQGLHGEEPELAHADARRADRLRHERVSVQVRRTRREPPVLLARDLARRRSWQGLDPEAPEPQLRASEPGDEPVDGCDRRIGTSRRATGDEARLVREHGLAVESEVLLAQEVQEVPGLTHVLLDSRGRRLSPHEMRPPPGEHALAISPVHTGPLLPRTFPVTAAPTWYGQTDGRRRGRPAIPLGRIKMRGRGSHLDAEEKGRAPAGDARPDTCL